MTRRPGQTEYQSAFGQALHNQLVRKDVRQADLSRSAGVSPAYINRLMNGSKVSPEWVDLIADVLKLDQNDRVTLHTAAAKTWGFKLDLTK